MLQMSFEILQSFKLLFVFIILPKSKHQKVPNSLSSILSKEEK